MVRRVFIYFTLSLCVFMANEGMAVSPYNVRVWKAADGMGESNCWRVSVDSSGNALVNHGPVRSLSYVTGYGVQRIPIDYDVGFLPYCLLFDNKVWTYDSMSSIGNGTNPRRRFHNGISVLRKGARFG